MINKKEISLEEQKKILVNMLKYIDSIARKNNIKYTLIGGSLIGAIRNGGIIPWDDDIDIALMPEEYDKLIECLKKENDNYKLLDVNTETSYYYPFAKLVDIRTTGFELNCKTINNYGVYIDILKYNYIPDTEYEIIKYYNHCEKLKKRLFRSFINDDNNFFKKIIHKIISKRNSRKIAIKLIKYNEQYNGKYTKKVMTNWTAYGVKKEIQMANCFNNYIDTDFENIMTMIVKDYDKVLNQTFGDYMTPPPIDKQVTHHHMKMFWRENEK